MKKERKYYIENMTRFMTFMCILIIFAITGFVCSMQSLVANIKAQYYTREQIIESYIVQPGDTLWKIGLENKSENQDIRDYIYELKKVNNLENSNLNQGQEIKILKNESYL